MKVCENKVRRDENRGVKMNRWYWWLMIAGALILVLAGTTALLVAAAGPDDGAPGQPLDPPPPLSSPTLGKLEPALAKALATAGPDARLNVIVEMAPQTDSPPLLVPSSSVGGESIRLAHRQALISALQQRAARSQAGVLTWLSTQQVGGQVSRVRPFWIFNGLAVGGAQPQVVRDLAARPDVALVRLDRWRQWIEPAPVGAPQTLPAASSSDVEWGVAQVRADQAWSALDISGTGVVVANIDSGVDWMHVALRSNYRGYSPKGFHQHEGNWIDVTGNGALRPVDGSGHGTHTMGTMVGQGGIGVAPGAQWIAARAFNSAGYAYDSWVHAAFEWVLAPAGDPALAPDVVNNSWSSSLGGSTAFQADLDALRAAGIWTVFSVGNNGPARRTVGSPASLPGAFAAGASDQEDKVATFSSRGPSPWGEVRPHLVAPGVNVRSATPGDAYDAWQGVSMAVPHVAGTAALVLSVNPDLNITQTSHILTSTAVPLSSTLPNNASGYGRVDAYAAVAQAGDAGLLTGSVWGTNVPVPDATVRAVRRDEGEVGSARSDEQGKYDLFLRQGWYEVTVRAFGYEPVLMPEVKIETGASTVRNVYLSPLPTGQVRGTVKSQRGGSVIATVAALNTPVSDLSDGAGGAYRLELPAGRYTLEARAVGYRVLTATVVVTAGQTTWQDFSLESAPRILLVDGGSWYYKSQIDYYRQALDSLNYAYKEWRIKHPPDDAPSAGHLAPYELVIWSSPQDSPGLVGAGPALTEYLSGGGHLLLSGQDVGFWDGGGTGAFAADYFLYWVHAAYLDDRAPSRQVLGHPAGPFEGITLTIKGPGGADNQGSPDEVGVRQPDHASLAFDYAGGEGAGIAAGFCTPYRALYLAFGFEGINQAAERRALLAQALDWFASPRTVHGLKVSPETNRALTGQAGSFVTHRIRLRNTGETGGMDTFTLQVEGNHWPTTPLSTSLELAACGAVSQEIAVSVPPGAGWNETDVMSVTVSSTLSPTLQHTLVLTTKSPAPVLLVDDDRWYDQEAAYESALRAAGVPYDYWQVPWEQTSGQGSPPAEVLDRYPVVLWFNGYDWFDPLNYKEEQRLIDYLKDGGRLFLSSQSYVGQVSSSDLVEDYFGVLSYTYALSQTSVSGVPGSALGDGLSAEPLDYPFPNLSDSLLPRPGAAVQFRSGLGQPGALTYASRSGASQAWRTALFVFPFEALSPPTRSLVMARLVGWLSWLGSSSLSADRTVVSPGGEVIYTLVARNDGLDLVGGVTVSNTLPPDTTLLDGPSGGARYVPEAHRVEWAGELAPGQAVTVSYRLQVPAGPPSGTGLLPALENVARISLGDQGFGFERRARVRVGAPDLSSSSLGIEPALAVSGRPVSLTLVLRNTGLTDTLAASLDNPLPWPMHLISGSLSGGGVGTLLPEQDRVFWQGPIPQGQAVTLTYQAAPLSRRPVWLSNAFQVSDGMGGVWEIKEGVDVEPQRVYLPIVLNVEP